MGYDLSITRAFMSYDSPRYPILATELDDLVRAEPDLSIAPGARRGEHCWVTWAPGGTLWFREGRIAVEHPAPAVQRRMTELAAIQPDFTTMTTIEAILPSGVRAIACPPITCWTGHPSGRPVPFFHDDDLIEVRHTDEPTIRRMRELAIPLAAQVHDE